jgi:hypothetical protein
MTGKGHLILWWRRGARWRRLLESLWTVHTVATATAIASGRDPGGHIGSHLETLRKIIGVSLQGFQRVQMVKVSEHEDHSEHKSDNEVQPLQYLT